MIDVVMITTFKRKDVFLQSMITLLGNSSDKDYPLTVVVDGPTVFPSIQDVAKFRLITNCHNVGASRSRNVGASSIPKYLRQKYVMFLDDDVYMMPGWDKTLLGIIDDHWNCIVSGYAHPFNKPIQPYVAFDTTSVISTVNMLMKWETWDQVGYFIEPGGPGGSEDVDYCRRAMKQGHELLVSRPQCVIHTGLTSSTGQKIVGHDLLVEQNRKLMEQCGIQDVLFQ